MSIRQMIEQRARALADHDGVAATIMHLHAAANGLGTEIRRELDSLVSEFRPAGAAMVTEVATEAPTGQPAQICAGDAAPVDGVIPASEGMAS